MSRMIATALLLAALVWASVPALAVVQNPRGYTLHFAASPSGFSPADATTYYLGGLFAMTPLTSANVQSLPIPRNGTVRRIDLLLRNLGTAGTAETSTVSFRLNDTSDTTITSSFVTNVGATYSATVAIPVVAGNTFEIKWVTPTWVTNPTSLALYGTVLIDVP